jgi:hypothetical protein
VGRFPVAIRLVSSSIRRVMRRATFRGTLFVTWRFYAALKFSWEKGVGVNTTALIATIPALTRWAFVVFIRLARALASAIGRIAALRGRCAANSRRPIRTPACRSGAGSSRGRWPSYSTRGGPLSKNCPSDQAVASETNGGSLETQCSPGSPTVNHKSGRAIVERADINSPKERRR